jgi:hypothetical protein
MSFVIFVNFNVSFRFLLLCDFPGLLPFLILVRVLTNTSVS